MRALTASFMIALVALAGCAEEAPPDAEDDTTEADADLQATESTGVIRGVVVDATITPIPAASVSLNTGQETTTLADGSFGFGDLEPGGYFISVSKTGYKPVQSSTTVEAGIDKPPVVRIQIDIDFENRPFSTLEVFEGYLQCGAGIGGAGSLNPCALTESVNTFDVPTGPGLNTTQMELVWEGTNAFGDGLSLGIYNPSTTASNFVGVVGPSPLTLRVSGERIEQHYGEDMPSYLARVFPGAGSDVGQATVVVEQRFEIFVTNFYGFAPDEDWTFLEDGEHSVPS